MILQLVTLPVYLVVLLLSLLYYLVECTPTKFVPKMTTGDHLIVLCHGLNGDHRELLYLERTINEISDCKVLNSKKNDGGAYIVCFLVPFHIPSFLTHFLTAFPFLFASVKFGINQIEELSKKGIKTCAEELAAEIREEVSSNPNLKKISMVGMSLGGLISRYAAKLLYDADRSTVAGLEPETFMCIASPFLGVKSNTFLPLPRFMERMVGYIIGDTGLDLFLMDSRKELIYDMNTAEEYLQPLRAFKYRRLYAAIVNDFMVPLRTAAFVGDEEAEDIRAAFSDLRGIVGVIDGVFSQSEEKDAVSISTDCSMSIPHDSKSKMVQMRESLNSLGWSKVFVNFGGFLPLAHLQICANERWPSWVTSPMGVDAGQEVMIDGARFLSQDKTGNSVTTYVDSSTCQVVKSKSNNDLAVAAVNDREIKIAAADS